MPERRYLAFDLGAESGRAVAGTLRDGVLAMEEIHRFPNRPVEVCGTLHWNVLALYEGILDGMRAYFRRHGPAVDSLGIDTWALDFGLLGPDGGLLQNPVHYRDRRTEAMVDEIARRMPLAQLYRLTGMTPSPILTLCQFLALRLGQSRLLECAETLLMMPDLLAYFLTGVKGCERTVVASSQLYSPYTHGWAEEVLRTFELPGHLMAPLRNPGTVVGELRPSVRRDTGLCDGVVVAPCSHDTASAIAAVPACRVGREPDGDDWAVVSCGTWSILGTLSDRPVTTREAFAAGICSELTVGCGAGALPGVFLCRNIMGLWLLQQARASWARQGHVYSYGDLAALAEASPAGGPILEVDDPAFLAPADMVDAIRDHYRRSGQRVPEGPGEVTRCVLQSLASAYARGLEQLQQVSGRRFRVLHIVGGGSQNALLCRLTADAAGIPVVAGPVEATVMGNLLVQALALGHLSSPEEAREVVRRSTALVEHAPRV